MKALVIYDSIYGNTKLIAETVAKTFKSTDMVQLARIKDASPEVLADVDIVVVGSPTQVGRATTNIQDFINNLPEHALDNKRVAAFDTRYDFDQHGFGLKILMKIIGFAAPRIAEGLRSKGGVLVAEPTGFIVREKDGPLDSGELEKAMYWTETILKA